jgi:phenylpropionate dioxygenase-like ring-hydroxylating dioxygenase large terminal subunit
MLRRARIGIDDIVDSPSRSRRIAVACAVRRRLVAHIALGGSTDMAETPLENDARAYTDPKRFSLERREIFLKVPLIAGCSQDIPNPGDILLFEELGRSVIILRGPDRRVRAFLNMCPHRGTRLMDANERCAKTRRTTITCPFHGWCFNLDGALVAMPGCEGFSGIASRRLTPVPAAETQGLIFVSLDLGREPLAIVEHLGAFADELEQLELGQLAILRGGSFEAACNWKLAIDTYAESYHFSVLHASTIGRTHFANVTTFDTFGPHWRAHFAEKSFADLVGVPESNWPALEFAAVHFIFPNTILVAGSVGGDMLVRMFRLFPGETPGLTTCQISVYGTLQAPWGEETVPGFVDEARNVVTEEDYRVAIGAQANLAVAPEGFRVIYGRNEPGLQAFHCAVAEAIGASPPSRPAPAPDRAETASD